MVLDGQSSQSIALAAQALQRGDLIGLPTETVYGLAADACKPLQKFLVSKVGLATIR